jgi:MFS superfamily sulfate permease-like transporter
MKDSANRWRTVPTLPNRIVGKFAEGRTGCGCADRGVRPLGLSGADSDVWRVSRLDFYAATIGLGAVLLLGILQGILLAALASIVLLLVSVSRPHVAFLGRIPGTNSYSDLARHPENEAMPGVIAFPPEASLIYVNADAILESAYIDLAGSRILHKLHSKLSAYGIGMRIVGAHGSVRDLLRADGIGDKVGGLDRITTLDSVLANGSSRG